MVVGIISWCLWRVRSIQTSEKLVLITFACASIYSYVGSELWVYPFQVVLTSFRLLFVISVLLFSLSLKKDSFRPKIPLLMLMAASIFLTSIAHGSGIIFIPFLLFISVLWRKKQHVIILSFLLGLLIIYELHTPPLASTLSSSEILLRSLQHPGILMSRTLYLLGYYAGLKRILIIEFSPILIGILGIILYGATVSAISLEANRKQSLNPIHLFFMIWAGFALIGTMMSVMTNIGYAELRNNEMTYGYFLASRYSVTVSGFWIGTLSLAVIQLREFFLSKLSFQHSNTISLSLIGLSLVVWINGIGHLDTWKRFHQDFLAGEVALQSLALDSLPLEESAKLISVPAIARADIKALVRIQQKYRLGPFAPGTTEHLAAIAQSESATVGFLDAVEPLSAAITRVKGHLSVSRNSAQTLSDRPVPIINSSGEVVGIAALQKSPYFDFDLMKLDPQLVVQLPFIGYVSQTINPKQVKAIFPITSTSFLQSFVQNGDQFFYAVNAAVKTAKAK